MLPENGCPNEPGNCGLPYYDCDTFITEDTCNQHGGGGKKNGRQSNNLCNWASDYCASWGETAQWPDTETFNQFKAQLEHGFMIVGGLWGNETTKMDWISNTGIGNKYGNNDITKASISVRNMTLDNR